MTGRASLSTVSALPCFKLRFLVLSSCSNASSLIHQKELSVSLNTFPLGRACFHPQAFLLFPQSTTPSSSICYSIPTLNSWLKILSAHYLKDTQQTLQIVLSGPLSMLHISNQDSCLSLTHPDSYMAEAGM